MAVPIGRQANPQLTREQVESVLVLPLMQQSRILAAGPRIFDSDGSQIRVPKLSTTSPPGWHGENEKITEADADFDSVILLPPNLDSVKVLTKMSNEILRQSVIALEAALRDRLVGDVSRAIDAELFAGTGQVEADGNRRPLGMVNWQSTDEVQRVAITGTPTGGTFTLSFNGRTTAPIAYNATPAAVRDALRALQNVPDSALTQAGAALPGGTVDITFTGLPGNQPRMQADSAGLTGGTNPTVVVTTTTPGVRGAQRIDLAGATPDIDDLHDAMGLAMGAWAEPTCWFMAPRSMTFLRKIRAVPDGRYMLEPDITQENRFTMLGLPVYVTNAMLPDSPTAGDSTIVLADMNQVAVGRDLEPNVRILDQTFGDYDQTAIRVVARYDIAPLNAEGVVLITNVGHGV